MKPIKKFSLIKSEESELLESMKANHGEMAVDLAKKLGYNSLEEIAKEKKILTKLESLLKALPKKFNVSEDDSKEIEDEVVAKGEPKSLEDMEGEKEGELDTEEEELETEEEELETEEEDDTEEEELETDEEEDETEEEELETEEEDDTEEEEDDTEEEEMPKATRRIKTFEEFIQEKEETINKNVSYRDDEDEEDYAEPVAASVANEANIAMRPSVERLLKQKGYDPIFQTIDKSKRDFKRLGYTKGEIEETLFDMFGNIDPKIVKKIKESVNEQFVNEANRKKVTKQMWAKMDYDERVDALLSFFKDPDDAEKYGDSDWNNLPNGADGGMYIFETKMTKLKNYPSNEDDEVNEARTFKGKEIFPNWVNSNELKGIIRKESDLTKGARYALLDLGLDVWQAEYEYEGKVGPIHLFKSTAQGTGKDSNIEFSDKELKDAVKNAEIALMEATEEQINEVEIKSDKDFEEYATTVLKNAFGDEFDKAKAQEVIDGLKSKYSGDYGAMVGALQSSLG